MKVKDLESVYECNSDELAQIRGGNVIVAAIAGAIAAKVVDRVLDDVVDSTPSLMDGLPVHDLFPKKK